MATIHAQVLQARDVEMGKLKELLASSMKKVKGAKYEREGARARLQPLQSGQQKILSAVCRVQNEISALAAGLVKDRDYFMKRQDKKCDRMFIKLRKFLVKR